MSKIDVRAILSVAESKNFSEYPDGEFDHFDNGEFEEKMYSDISASQKLIDLLMRFDDREKIIFLYALLKQAGYTLDGDDCAKTLSISKQWYFNQLKIVRGKARKALLEENK